MNCNKYLLTLVFLVLCLDVLAQSEGLKETEKGMQIRQGLFLTFEDFKQNSPVDEESIVTSYPRGINFYYNLLREDNVKSTESSSSINTATIWGYFDGKSLYLNVKKFPSLLLEGIDISGHSWAQVNETGKICLINYNENFNPQTGAVNPEMGRNQSVLFLMDTRDGSLRKANAGNLEDLIQDDPRVLSAFNNHAGDREESLYTFIKIYNERHKLELP